MVALGTPRPEFFGSRKFGRLNGVQGTMERCGSGGMGLKCPIFI